MTTLVEYMDRRLGVHRGRGPEYVWHCPACIDRMGSESDTPKLHVNLNRRFGHCFRCEYGFRSLETLFRYVNNGKLTIEEAKLLRKVVQLSPHGPRASVLDALKKRDRKWSRLRPVKLPENMIDLSAENLSPLANRAWRYLRSRNVGIEEVVQHSIGFCATGEFAGYLVFPVFQGGKQVYFTTRFTDKATSGMKSKNVPKAEGYHTKSTVLLNYDYCVGQPLIGVVEGPFDVMGWGNAVGIMGKEISDEQVALIASLVSHGLEEVVVSLDDEAGRQAVAVYRRLVDRVPKVSILFLDHGDPFDRRDELPSLLDERRAPTARDFVLHRAVMRRKPKARR